MMQKRLMVACIALSMVCASCVHQYQLTNIQRTQIVVDRRYDATHDKAVEKLMPVSYTHLTLPTKRIV